MPRIAIVSALHEELHTLLPLIGNARRVELGGRIFHLGEVHGQPVVMVLSGIGKVAAAATAALLIQAFEAAPIVFTGTAGGLGPGVRVGDIVLADRLLQHDLDASPLFPRFEVPLTGRSEFETDAPLSAGLRSAALHCLHHAAERIGETHLAAFGIDSPVLHDGLVVSGDRFVATAVESDGLRRLLPQALAVEMEGAAFAQVCHDFGRPLAVLRTVSDRADDSAHVDFPRFLAQVASLYSREIVSAWLSGVAAA